MLKVTSFMDDDDDCIWVRDLTAPMHLGLSFMEDMAEEQLLVK